MVKLYSENAYSLNGLCLACGEVEGKAFYKGDEDSVIA